MASQHSTSDRYADLTQINGIGPARQKWLRDTFRIRTYADLADMSPEDIMSRLRPEGKIVAMSAIESWIEQAGILASALPEFERESLHVPPDAWKPSASFVVEFRERTNPYGEIEREISVHHMEADEGETWPESAASAPWDWMLARREPSAPAPTPAPIPEKPRAERPVPEAYNIPEIDAPFSDKMQQVLAHARALLSSTAPEPESHNGDTSPAGEELHAPVYSPTPAPRPETLRLCVTQIRAYQPTQGQMHWTAAGRSMLQAVKANEPFTLDVAIDIEKLDPERSDHPMSLTAAAFAHNLMTGHAHTLGNTEMVELSTGEHSCTASLPAAALDAGMYRLQIVTRLVGEAVTGYFEMPLLQVI